MDVEKILAQLREERDLIDQVIIEIETLARDGKPRRGRPPAWITSRNAAIESLAKRSTT